jgi:hypothetical protein
MSVPEIPVNEDGHPFSAKNEIGRTENIRVPSPTFDATGTEQRYQAQLSVSISPRANGCHYCRSLLLGKDVGHESYV